MASSYDGPFYGALDIGLALTTDQAIGSKRNNRRIEARDQLKVPQAQQEHSPPTGRRENSVRNVSMPESQAASTPQSIGSAPSSTSVLITKETSAFPGDVLTEEAKKRRVRAGKEKVKLQKYLIASLLIAAK
jgi:hypothetical protein